MPSNSTLSDLAHRVARDLGILGAEETLSAADYAWITQTCTSEVAMMADLGMPVWNGSEASVPPQYLTALSRRIGLAIAPSFGLTDPATAMASMREAERPLSVMAAPRLANPTLLRSDDSKRSGSRFNFSTGL